MHHYKIQNTNAAIFEPEGGEITAKTEHKPQEEMCSSIKNTLKAKDCQY